jgi:hypothetical protein
MPVMLDWVLGGNRLELGNPIFSALLIFFLDIHYTFVTENFHLIKTMITRVQFIFF